ncbi:hypothetical protein SDC9_46662 [bioreactor metagenome]|uniref:Uncharacterized protein n=1 Tax=bioreactor metagenome TaxID=1076179 RepID=A0A644WA92_9ZZZZ
MQIVAQQDTCETRNVIWRQEYKGKNNKKRYTIVSRIEPTDATKAAAYDIRKFLEIENGEIIPTKSGVRLPHSIIVEVLEALYKSLDEVQRNDFMDRICGGTK